MSASDFLLLMIAPVGASVIAGVLAYMSFMDRKKRASELAQHPIVAGLPTRTSSDLMAAYAAKPGSVNVREFHTEGNLDQREARLAP